MSHRRSLPSCARRNIDPLPTTTPHSLTERGQLSIRAQRRRGRGPPIGQWRASSCYGGLEEARRPQLRGGDSRPTQRKVNRSGTGLDWNWIFQETGKHHARRPASEERLAQRERAKYQLAAAAYSRSHFFARSLAPERMLPDPDRS